MKTPYIISKGKLFQNLKTNGRWNRYHLPFDVPEIVTPKFVSELISWVTKGSEAIKIEWKRYFNLDSFPYNQLKICIFWD